MSNDRPEVQGIESCSTSELITSYVSNDRPEVQGIESLADQTIDNGLAESNDRPEVQGIERATLSKSEQIEKSNDRPEVQGIESGRRGDDARLYRRRTTAPKFRGLRVPRATERTSPGRVERPPRSSGD